MRENANKNRLMSPYHYQIYFVLTKVKSTFNKIDEIGDETSVRVSWKGPITIILPQPNQVCPKERQIQEYFS